MQLLTDYVNAVTASLWAVAGGANVNEQLDLLAPMRSEVMELVAAQASQIHALENEVAHNPSLQNARRTHAQKAELKRNAQPFLLNWSGGKSEQVIGWYAIVKRVGLAESSIRTKLSLGKESFSLERVNPLTHEPDILVVTRLALPEADGPTRRKIRGRPRTRPLTEAEMAVD